MNSERVVVPYVGIGEGNYEYDFNLGKNFFSQLDYSEFETGDVAVHIDMDKHNHLMILNLMIAGEVEVCCDRCLDLFNMPISFNGCIYASEDTNFDQLEEDENTEFIELNASDREVDLTHYVYESISLSLPLQRIHPNDKNGNSLCNKEMLKILHSHQVENEDEENNEDLLNINDN
jgi:uncharacterized metal-binding protein YceD (DUF177 family)